VLVHAGAGGVGLAAIQLAHAAGAIVLTTSGSDEKLERLRALGADHAINYKAAALKDAVTAAVGAEGVELVLDSVGGKTLQESVGVLRYRGRIISLGVLARDWSAFNVMPLWGKNASLTGLGLMGSLQNDYKRTYGAIAECIRRVAAGELRVIIDRRFPLAEAAAAHAYVEQRKALGRVIMRPR
jgi:NADPH2:quinone reductase